MICKRIKCVRIKCFRLGILAALLILLSSPAFASLVSFMVVETGLDESVLSTQHGSVWEGGLMDAFFDAGFIVTNSPVTRIESRPAVDLSGIILNDFEDAEIGGAEFFILAYLDCQDQGGRMLPLNMTLKMYSINSRQLVFEQSFPVSMERTLEQEFEVAKNAGRILINYIRTNRV